MTNEKKLQQFYNKYINKPIYRAIPLVDYNEIKNNGIDPTKNPYNKIKPSMKKLANIILKLEKEGYSMKLKWGGVFASGNFAVKNMLDDINREFIDFASNKKQVEFYSKIVSGGALAVSIKRVTKRLMEDKPNLTNHEWQIIKQLNRNSQKRIGSMKVLYIQGNSKILEKGLIHLLKKKKKHSKFEPSYLSSPFGSFEHFKRVITKYGFRKCSYWLKSENYYLRIKEKIPAKEIRWIK